MSIVLRGRGGSFRSLEHQHQRKSQLGKACRWERVEQLSRKLVVEQVVMAGLVDMEEGKREVVEQVVRVEGLMGLGVVVVRVGLVEGMVEMGLVEGMVEGTEKGLMDFGTVRGELESGVVEAGMVEGTVEGVVD